MNIPDTNGIMFAMGPDGFPTVADIGRSSWSYAMDVRGYGYAYVDAFSDWLAIAHDPYAVRYFDDDAQGLDEINYDAVIAAFSFPHPKPIPSLDEPLAMDDEAMSLGIATVGRLLIIDPNNADHVGIAEGLAIRLADYPVLDDEAHSTREYNDALATLVACYDVTDEEAPAVFSFLFETRSYCRGSEYTADHVSHALTALGLRWECADCGDVTDDESNMRGDRCQSCEAERVDAWLWAACAC